MKKLICPRCGVINLEKFVTFPHCAGCGTLLSGGDAVSPELPLWKRPLRVRWWATFLGLSVLALLATVFLFQSVPAQPGQLIIYGRAPRKTHVGTTMSIVLTIDNLAPTGLKPVEWIDSRKIRDFSLRLSGEIFQNFTLLSLDPEPDFSTTLGSGRYFSYRTLPRETPIHLLLRPRSAGNQRLRFSVQARDHLPTQFQTTIRVQNQVKKVPVNKNLSKP